MREAIEAELVREVKPGADAKGGVMDALRSPSHV